MKERENIDNRVREKLENFQVAPPPHIWDNVQEKLVLGKRRKRIAYAGWISAAAVVVLAFIAGWFFNENSGLEKNAVILEENIKNEVQDMSESVQPGEKLLTEQNTIEQTENIAPEASRPELIAAASVMDLRLGAKTEVVQTELKRDDETFIKLKSTEVRFQNNNTADLALNKEAETLPVAVFEPGEEQLIAENIRNFESENKGDAGWKMGMFVAPGYSSFNAAHSESYAQNMTSTGNSGNASVGGGVSVQYKTKKRWIFESGVYYAQSGQEFNQPVNLFAQNRDTEYLFDAPESVPVANTNVRVENQNLVMNSTAGVIEFKSTPKGAAHGGEFDATTSKTQNVFIPEGEYSQVFDFMEIPLFVRYRVLDKKLGLELITGVNAGIVVGNNSFLNNQYGLQNVGETRDISTFNVSGTLGLGFNYALSKHFSVALEPRYNYYLNSINTSSSVDFKPYRIGLYTGLTYEF